jgi:hypothetical protein
MSSGGLWIQSSASDNDIFTDSKQFDGVIRTENLGSRILFGFSNNSQSAVAISTDAVSGHAMSVSGKLAVAGDLLVASRATGGGAPVNIAVAIEDLRKAGITPGGVGTSALADGCVTTAKIAAGAVTPANISGVLPVTVGGTGISALPSNAVPYGSVTAGGLQVLATDASRLFFEPATATLTASNASVPGRLHAFSDIVAGKPGGVRFRLTVDGGGDLVMTKISAAGVETPYINFKDVKAIVDNIAVIP